jgi:hypothetical protein
MDGKQMLGIVERYIRKSGAEYTDPKVTRVADRQTMFVEQIGEESGGRSVMMTEYKVDGVTYWAGYSLRSQTVYISQAT